MHFVSLRVGLALAVALSTVIADLDRPGDEEYIVWPVNPIRPEMVASITSALVTTAGGQAEVYMSTVPRRPSPLYWLAKLPAKDVGATRSVFGVKSIYLNKEAAKPFFSNRIAKVNATFPNFWKYATQLLPATELRVISQPSGSAKIDRYKNYVYRTDKRKESYIYQAELGINTDHEDFQSVPIEWDWTDLQVRRGGRTKGEAPSWYFGHSTCTASKAAGSIYGSAKQERLVVIKMPDYTTTSLAEIMWTMFNHVYDRGRRDRSVVTTSWDSIVPVAFPLDPQNDLWLAVYQAMTALWSLGVVIFCTAGNDAQELNMAGRPRTLVDTAPAVFQLYAAFPPMVVVGNVNNYGYRHPTSQRTGRGDGPQVHAPGVKVQCASPTSTSDSRFDTGTSFSAPLVAGVVAELVAVGAIASDMLPDIAVIALTTIFGWTRPNGGEYVIWDLIPGSINPPGWGFLNASLSGLVTNLSDTILAQ
ncbi:MAG: hypothetical protein ASARMPRED_007736 [Alectoria sarmentosa]|nr:MAG: hypothetical protein ASARMPRED_007736 [Alectoria sarmentosa]